MPSELWGLGAAGITIHFRCWLCGEEVSVRQDFIDVTPILWRPPPPSGWICLMDHWYCNAHPSEKIAEEIWEMANA